MTFKYHLTLFLFFFSIVLILLPSHFTPATAKISLQTKGLIKQRVKNDHNLEKITFDISQISSDGLIGSADNLRSLSYEFCIPKNPQSLAEIKKIDPEINFSQSKGRIGCTENQYLCIGDTHKPNWLEILNAIADLDYVERIDQFFGE